MANGINWQLLTQIPQSYAEGQSRARETALRDALAGGLPRGAGGAIDYNAAVELAARAGSMPGITAFAGLANQQAQRAQAGATLAETRRYHDILAGQTNRPQIQMDAPDPTNPGAPRTGTVIITDKQGNVTLKPLGGGAAQPQPQPPPVDDPWARPSGVLPGPRSSLPGGPTVAQAHPAAMPPPVPMAGAAPLTPSEQLLAQAEDAPQLPPRGPAYAQAGAAKTAPQIVPPPQAPQIPPSTWLRDAQAPAYAQPPVPEPVSPFSLAPEQRGELRYATPAGPFNEAAIAQYPKAFQDKVRALVSGRYNIKSSAITGGERAALSNAAFAYYPGWDEQLFSKRQAAQNDMARGIRGRVVTAVNNLTDHLETATSLMLALQNGQVPAINAAVNKWRQVTGSESELPANVHAAAPIIAGEMMKVIAGAGAGGVNERLETAINTMSTSTNPKTALSVLNTIKQLMAGQLKSTEQWYETSTYNTDFRTKISKGARKIIEEMDHPQVSAPGAAGAPTPAHIETLKRRPDTAPLFDKKYGTPADPNPSRRFLGGQ